MKKEPIIITRFPGEAVDRHLKLFGHLPTKLCEGKECLEWEKYNGVQQRKNENT